MLTEILQPPPPMLIPPPMLAPVLAAEEDIVIAIPDAVVGDGGDMAPVMAIELVMAISMASRELECGRLCVTTQFLSSHTKRTKCSLNETKEGEIKIK